jgi:hypothetical protein
MYLEYFPEELLALQEELKQHPEILGKLEGCASEAEAFGRIGAELGIVLDGIYNPLELAGKLTTELQARRRMILE